MARRDAAVLALGCALLGFAFFRLLNPTGLPTRQLSVEGVEIKSQPIRSGESLVHEANWLPPDDVFVVGWAPEVGARQAQPTLLLSSAGVTFFLATPLSPEGFATTFVPSGTGFLVRKGQPVTLRLEIRNSGPDGETRGARALIYFHPVTWR
jgi:hypothetical protein